MLKEAVRRLLWLGPTLLVVTLPIFWEVARATDRFAKNPARALPLFFNPSPAGIRERALAALSEVARGGEGSAAAAAELVRLGGAALPHVLPRFDALGPDARGRVALSLAPLARRMGIGSSSELDTPEVAELLWSRFWEAHAIDFRPAVVRRTVRRFVDHPSELRESEVSELDTVALEDLMDAFGTVKTAPDATRVRHIAALAARMTDQPWLVSPGTSIDAASRVAERWKHWWLGARSGYVAFTGPRRLVATVLETRYGKWLEELARRADAPGSGRTATLLASRAPTTLLLVASGLFFGYPLSVAFAVWAALAGHRRRDRLVSAAALTSATAGIAGTAAVLAGATGAHARLFFACAAVALTTAALSLRHRRTIARRTAELVHLRTARAFGAGDLRLAVKSIRLTLALALALAVADLPGLMTYALVAERVFSLHGIGATTVEALRSGDQRWLLSVALFGTLTVGFAQIAADLLLGALDPRVQTSRPSRVTE